MSGSVNKAILIGNLGKDPEIRRLENGGIVGNFTIATSDVYVDKSSGEKKETTDWHTVVVWNKLAEITEKYLKKGMKVYVEGRLKNRTWTDQNGTTKYITEIFAHDLTILTVKGTSSKTVDNIPYTTEVQPPITPTNLGENTEDILPF
jgi:single-strand DNA-binding protein